MKVNHMNIDWSKPDKNVVKTYVINNGNINVRIYKEELRYCAYTTGGYILGSAALSLIGCMVKVKRYYDKFNKIFA